MTDTRTDAFIAERANYALDEIQLGRVKLLGKYRGEEHDSHLLRAQEAIRQVVERFNLPERPETNLLAAVHIHADTEEMIAHLRKALQCAERIDTARGNFVEGIGGTDLVDRIEQLIAGAELSLDAPKGRD